MAIEEEDVWEWTLLSLVWGRGLRLRRKLGVRERSVKWVFARLLGWLVLKLKSCMVGRSSF